MRILIGLPTYNRTLDIEIAKGLVLLEREGYDFDMVFPVSSHISRNRNYIVHEFLKGDCDYLLFWDADIVPDEGFLYKMLDTMYKHDAHIVGGCYSFKDFSNRIVAGYRMGIDHYRNVEEEEFFRKDKQFEVDAIGTGLMLIKREVLVKIQDPWFTILDEEKLHTLPEDFYFCQKAKFEGFKIMADKSFRVKHYGVRAFEW